MIDKLKKNKCCGCSSCYSICPVKAIKMEEGFDGFYYPVIDYSKCINCNLCESTCPELNNEQLNKDSDKIKKYAIQNLDEQCRKKSTAGGAFMLVADYVLQRDGYVCAAGFKDGNVTHFITRSREEAICMTGSKYVQSKLDDCFCNIINLTKKGIMCLFVGTPCQVSGLKKICNSEYLITIDLLCLGVPSPGVYNKWIKYLEEKYESKIDFVSFRDKSYGYATSNCKVFFKSGKSIDQCYDTKSFLKTFFTGLNMRESCYDCKFRMESHVSDFTIGDYHDIGEIDKSMDDDKGTSVLWVNTNIGNQILKELQLEKKVTSRLIDNNSNRVLYETSRLTSCPVNRENFFEDAKEMDYKTLVNKYAPNDFKSILANIFKPLLKESHIGKFVFRLIKKQKQRKFKKRVKNAQK